MVNSFSISENATDPREIVVTECGPDGNFRLPMLSSEVASTREAAERIKGGE